MSRVPESMRPGWVPRKVSEIMSAVPEVESRAATGSGGGRIVLGVIGALLTLIGFGLLAGGGTVLWANASQRDGGGFFTSSRSAFASPGFAVTSERLRLVNGLPDRLSSPGDIVTFTTQGGSSNGKPLFIGVAPVADVTAYLSGVAHDEVVNVHMDGWKGPLSKDYRSSPGGPPAGPPAAQPFWTAKTTGTNVSLTWPASEGTWSIVVMNADASAGVAANLSLGVKVNFLGWVALGLLTAGSILLLAGVAMMFFGFRSPHTGAGSGAAVPPASPAGQLAFQTGDEKAYPVLIHGELDPGLSRWLWLVKWLLAIPHYIVLAFLWLAAVLLTVVAFFAILFTGRYPRGIFDFNVGVLRWTWRVAFYSCSVLGSDRYPPFTLADVDYPARFDVPYPERLSRGRVLVKSWLLAIPHYMILAVLIGNWGWTFGGDRWTTWGLSLNGILVLIAAVILLVTGRYPRDIFGLVLGINRWALRVAAYVMLMRDEYPPFRLDR